MNTDERFFLMLIVDRWWIAGTEAALSDCVVWVNKTSSAHSLTVDTLRPECSVGNPAIGGIGKGHLVKVRIVHSAE